MTIATNLRTVDQRLDPPAASVELEVPIPRDAQQKLDSVSQSPLTPVLIVAPGESRRSAARALHRLTYPNDPHAPFVEFDCTLHPEESALAELFGQEHDGHNGNGNGRSAGGAIARARGGTLFVDHVVSLPLAAQARLVRLLDALTERGSSPRAGEEPDGVRIVAGSERDPLGAVEAGRLRDDLFRELAVFRIEIPPLRARSADVLELARGYVQKFAERLNKPLTGLGADAEQALLAYDFPGNERELRGIIERATILAQGTELSPGDLGLEEARQRQATPADHFFWVDANPGGVPPPLDVVDRAYVARVLSHTSGRRLAAAHLLGISYPTFLKRLRELGFDRPAQRSGERSRV